MADDTKKSWEKPELEQLAQGKPEEAVLGACKSTSTQGPADAAQGRLVGCSDDNTADQLCSSRAKS